MKTIGLIGGTTWLSTVEYYRLINKMVSQSLGGDSSAKIILYSFDFAEIRPPADLADWKDADKKLSRVAEMLEKAGADCILFCANTPHLFADYVQARIGIPLLHIAEATAKVIKAKEINKAGLLGTKITMEQSFYRDKLSECGISTLIPDEAAREFINNSIFNELGKEIFTPKTKERYLEIIAGLKQQGAEGIILGCTEIPLIIKQSDTDIPLFDTTEIHARAAVEFALRD